MTRMLRLAALPVVATLIAGTALAENGNGAAVGKGGFLANIIAFDHCPGGDFIDSQRHQIAVKASYQGNGTDKTAKVNKIFLASSGVEGDFWIYDGNACDDGAYFYLPIDADNCATCGLGEDPTVEPTFTQYEVYARMVGPRNSKVQVTSCVEEAVTDEIIDNDTTDTLCSVSSNVWVQERTVGKNNKPSWDNVSKYLLTVCVDTDDTDGVVQCDERLGLFDPAGASYWWQWDAWGRPHVQLVFHPVESGM